LKEGEDDDHPHLYDVEQRKHAKKSREPQAERLRRQNQTALVDAIGDRPAEKGEGEERKRLGKRNCAESKCRPVTEFENQKRLGDDLHPGADRRAQEAEPQESKIPVSKHSERPAASRGDGLDRANRPRTE
jgi:hypothetical protein